MDDRALTDAERFPLLTDAGRRTLDSLRDHLHAPRWTHQIGERLDAARLAEVRRFAEEVRASHPTARPPWLDAFVERCLADVPFYRRKKVPGTFFTTSREDVRREPWAFVPDPAPLSDLIVYGTSGTTGDRLDVLSHPTVPAKALVLIQKALAARGVALEGGPGRTAIVQVCAQKSTWTFASVSTLLGEAGFAKVNLAATEWRDPLDPVRFLESCAPEVYSGDPISFEALARLPLRARPKALVSTAMALGPAFRAELEARFGCPAIDIYSLAESGPIAVGVPGPPGGAARFELLPHDIHVEVVDADGRPCPPGVRGEIAVTGGRNPFLPLLRYRTGDQAALDVSGPVPALVGLEGRAPTVFRDARGERVNDIDVSRALDGFAIAQYRCHQRTDGSIRFSMRGARADRDSVRRALESVFGPGAAIEIDEIPDSEAWAGKVAQYSTGP